MENQLFFFFFFVTLFSHLMLICSAAHDDQLSTSSVQIKFWYENVQNEMPNLFVEKLSPLSKQNCDLFTDMISKNDTFTAGSYFCYLAKLYCASTIDKVHGAFQGYSQSRYKYQLNSTFGNVNPEPFSFFRLSSILKIGNLIQLPNLDNGLPHRAFLPSQIASQISLADIMKIFPTHGATHKAVEESIFYCNAERIDGEVKSCPRSLEEMISFSKSVLGGGVHKKLLALMTSRNTKGYSNVELMVKKTTKYKTEKNVVCHDFFLPFAAYYCHSLSSTILYEVDLIDPRTGSQVDTLIAICHMDTSPWSAEHVSLRILKLSPGEGEACHWVYQNDLVWINSE